MLINFSKFVKHWKQDLASIPYAKMVKQMDAAQKLRNQFDGTGHFLYPLKVWYF